MHNSSFHQINRKKTGSGILCNPANADKILSLTADTMFLINRKGICVDLEIHTDRWYLQDPAYFLGKSIFRQIPQDTANALLEEFIRIKKNGDRSEMNYELDLAGKKYYFKGILSYYDEEHVILQYRDITQRIVLKQRLELMNNKLQEVEKVARIGHWIYNGRTRVLRYSSFPGGIPQNTENKNVKLDDFLKNILPEFHKPLQDYLDKGFLPSGKEFLDYTIILAGLIYHFRIRIINTYTDEEGESITEGYIQNITDIVEKQNELEMITLAVQNSTDYIFAMQPDGQLVFGNQKFREHHRLLPAVQTNELNFFKDIQKDSGKLRWKDIVQQLVSTRRTLNFVIPRPVPGNRDILAFDCTSYLIKDSAGTDLIWTFGKDITERVHYEKQVKELNQIMSTVLTNIPMNIDVKDADNDFRYIFSNRVGKKIHWGKQDDIIGKTDFDLFHKRLAKKMREDDLATFETREGTRKIIVHKDPCTNNIIYYDQVRLLVEDNSRTLLISIERDITKDKLMEKELIDAKEKAEQSDKLKSAFIANMSHEIRTPLNAIVGFSKIIAETNDQEERKSYYSIVETNNGRLLGLINEILDLSKIESGIMEFDLEPTGLSAQCKDIQQSMGLRCAPGVELLFEESDPDMVIRTDKNRLSQVLNNLIGNAIKFTRHGSIRFRYELIDEWLTFTVTDTGTGIHPDKIDKVFDRFIKGDNFTQGTGLGLPICKSIIEKMGGQIYVESMLGEGTCFTFTLPAECIISSSHTKNPNLDESDGYILVAEDDDSNYQLIEEFLSEKYAVRRAINGMSAITMFQEDDPRLILMDIRMPIINGIDAAKIIRSINPRIPIIILSAFDQQEERNAAQEAGCNEFISKPFSQSHLIETLARYLS